MELHGTTLIGFAAGREEWLVAALRSARGRRILVFGDSIPAALPEQTDVTLAFLPLRTICQSFNRIGRWPVVFTPLVHEGRSYDVIRLCDDYVDVTVGKPLGSAFAPHLFVADPGAPEPVAPGVPFFIREKPLLTVAHIADSQIGSDRVKSENPIPLDERNFKQAIDEINELKPDLFINGGDLVNRGQSEEQWAKYCGMLKDIKVPYCIIAGNHDADGATIEGEFIFNLFTKYTRTELQYTVSIKGFDIHMLGSGTDYAAYLSKVAPAKRMCALSLHDPLPDADEISPALLAELKRLRPVLVMAGHTHRLQWTRAAGIPQFIGAGLGWTFTGDPAWNGYFIHSFYEDKVVSSFKRLGVEGIYLTNIVRPQKQEV